VPESTRDRTVSAGQRNSIELAGYTTLQLGGPAGRLVVVDTDELALAALRSAHNDPVGLVLLAGGSNVVVDDSGFGGTVIVIRTSGLQVTQDRERVRLRVAAGQPWDEVVSAAVTAGWSGIECLSGIPGSAGATPIQNVGAYGQEVAETIAGVRVFDRASDHIRNFTPQECGFTYRSSVFKHNDRFVVLSVDFELVASALSRPIRYTELAGTLDVAPGACAPLADVREAVLALRKAKGMVLDATDPDTYSVGSFFTNPVLDGPGFATVCARADGLGAPPVWPAPGGAVKTSAAWLIERAGFGKGYGHPGTGVAVSTKHTLALTNRGTGSTAALLELAREIRHGVRERFGVTLHPEPVLVGCTL
jgi:UDP-N-acetylmuramate dehydrogenase